eukprot:57731_1
MQIPDCIPNHYPDSLKHFNNHDEDDMITVTTETENDTETKQDDPWPSYAMKKASSFTNLTTLRRLSYSNLHRLSQLSSFTLTTVHLPNESEHYYKHNHCKTDSEIGTTNEYLDLTQDADVCCVGKSITDCIGLQRILSLLSFYNTHWNAFDEIDKYLDKSNMKKHIINDYHHVLDKHLNEDNMSKRKSNKQFELIYKQILSHLFCDITRCEIYCRNHREREVQYIECDSHDPLLAMFIDLLDSIHCYFCHSVDIGYRIIHKLPPMDAHTAHGAYDSEMAQLRDYLSLNEEILQQLHTKKHWRNNRFMTKLKQVDAVARAKTDIRMEGYLRKESLYLKQLRQRYIVLRDDCLYSYKTHNKADLTECIALTEFNHVQICHDGPVGQFELIHDGSKKKRVFVASCMQELDDWLHEFKQIIATYHTNHSDKGRSRAASQLHFGERYDYWSSDRIFPKYATIKEELTSNKIYSIHMDAFNAAFTKSKFLLKNSHKLRNMMTCAKVAAKYNLRWDAVLRIDHVIAVVLWTDYRSLAAQLKSTFTKISKKIYDEFWIWSRFLIEAVNGFGTRLKKSRVKTCYHSVSFMHYTEYETTFNVPTSTTTKLQIIILNTPSNGMILELGHNSDRYTQKQRYFNCSFVSCFGMEDERLFIQPHDEKYYFHVLSIRNLRTNENYYRYIEAMDVLRRLVCNGFDKGDSRSVHLKCVQMVNYLVSMLYSSSSNHFNEFQECPSYIRKTLLLWSES